MKHSFALVMVLCVTIGVAVSTPPVLASGYRIVTTGDSITGGYSPVYITQSFVGTGVTPNVVLLNDSGCTTERYRGLIPNPITGAYRDVPQEVVNADGDYILLLLGANDAGSIARGSSTLQLYEDDMTAILHQYCSSVNSRDNHPTVILSTVIPQISTTPGDQPSRNNQVIDNLINPWLRQEAPRQGVVLLDLNVLIQQVPNWQSFYDDSVHLRANNAAGYVWMAGQWRDKLLELFARPVYQPGDANGDGVCDFSDYQRLEASFGQAGMWNDGDFDRDGTVTFEDYQILESNFGRSQTVVPEPATTSLLALGALAMIRRRR